MNLLQIGSISRGYKIIDKIGSGKFSQVYLGSVIQQDGELVALKVTSFEQCKRHQGLIGRLLQNEINALKLITQSDNQNVIYYIDDYKENNCVILVEEYCNSDTLTNFWKQKGKQFEEEEAIGLLKQLLNGLKGLHSKFIIHRDIKMDNILLQNESTVKIADLGFCDILQVQDQKLRLSLGSFGTEAPEILNEQPYGLEADIFSMGVIFYQLLFGEYPFPLTIEKFMKSCKNGDVNYSLNGVKISDQTKDLISRMLKYDPQERITFIQIYDHMLIKRKELSAIGVSRIRINADAIQIEQNANFYKENYKSLQKSILQVEAQQGIKLNLPPKFQQLSDQSNDQKNDQLNDQFNEKMNLEQNQVQNEYQNENYEAQQIYQQQMQYQKQIAQEINQFNQYINQIFYVCNTIFEIINQQKTELSHVVYLLCLHALNHFESVYNNFRNAQQYYKNYKLPKDYLAIEKIINDMIELLKHQKEQSKQDLMNLNQEQREIYQQNQINVQALLKDIIQKELQQHPNTRLPILYHHLIFCYKYFNLNNIYPQYNISLQQEFSNPGQLIESFQLLIFMNTP